MHGNPQQILRILRNFHKRRMRVQATTLYCKQHPAGIEEERSHGNSAGFAVVANHQPCAPSTRECPILNTTKVGHVCSSKVCPWLTDRTFSPNAVTIDKQTNSPSDSNENLMPMEFNILQWSILQGKLTSSWLLIVLGNSPVAIRTYRFAIDPRTDNELRT